jgi:hypothetical protein
MNKTVFTGNTALAFEATHAYIFDVLADWQLNTKENAVGELSVFFGDAMTARIKPTRLDNGGVGLDIALCIAHFRTEAALADLGYKLLSLDDQQRARKWLGAYKFESVGADGNGYTTTAG